MNLQIMANDKIYTYSNHAMEQAEDREIPKAWVIAAIENPTSVIEDSRGNALYHYTVKTGGGVYPIKVVVDESTDTIVTVMRT